MRANSSKGFFSFRGLVSVMAAFSFVAMAISGAILFISPRGRFANWTGWQILGIDKEQWGAVHSWFAVMFLTTCVFHIYLNWRPLINYFKGRVSRKLALRKEWIIAVVIGIVIFAGTLAEVPPFANLIDWQDTIKDDWERTGYSAPIPHAEILTLRQLARETGSPLEEMIGNLKNKGIEDITGDEIVEDLAREHNISPQELFKAGLGEEVPTRQETRGGGGGRGYRGGGNAEEGEHGGAGGGYGFGGGRGGGGYGRGGGLGRLSLKEICAQENLELEEALEKLSEAGIEARAELTVREIAQENDMRPFEVVEMMKVE